MLAVGGGYEAGGEAGGDAEFKQAVDGDRWQPMAVLRGDRWDIGRNQVLE